MLSLLQKVLSRSARRSAGHAGVVLGEDSFALVLVRRDGGGKPSIDHCRVHPSRGSLAATLRSRLDKLGASRAATCAVVDAEDYQVVQVEAPEVLPSEMRAAIRWRLRDAISFQGRRRGRGRLRDSGIRASHGDSHAVRGSGAFGSHRTPDQHAPARRQGFLRDRHP